MWKMAWVEDSKDLYINKLINFLLDLSILRLIIMAHMLQIRLHAYHPVIREGQFVLACGGGLGIQVEFQM